MANAKTDVPAVIYNHDAMSAQPLNEQYAHFCALGFPDDYESRYKEGLVDFLRLIQIDGIESIGINWEVPELLIGTELIEVTDKSGNVRVLGHYMIHFTFHGYKLANLTPLVANGSLYAHPHANQSNSFCMHNGSELMQVHVCNGVYAVPTQVIMTSLRMRSGTVTLLSPYSAAALENWPERSNQ